MMYVPVPVHERCVPVTLDRIATSSGSLHAVVPPLKLIVPALVTSPDSVTSPVPISFQVAPDETATAPLMRLNDAPWSKVPEVMASVVSLKSPASVAVPLALLIATAAKVLPALIPPVVMVCAPV